jgi:hypothetical protein
VVAVYGPSHATDALKRRIKKIKRRIKPLNIEGYIK